MVLEANVGEEAVQKTWKCEKSKNHGTQLLNKGESSSHSFVRATAINSYVKVTVIL